MATLSDAIEIYKYYRCHAFLVGVNNVVCLYKDRKFVFDKRVADYVIYGSHQNRTVKRVGYFNYKRETLEPAEDSLCSPDITKMIFSDFDDLFIEVKRRLKGIKNIRDLTYYDAALRIGFLMGLFPKQYVYLYAGAWEGLKKLKKYDPTLFLSKPDPFTKNGKHDISHFRSAFGSMESMFIEDFLCVFDRELGNLGACTKEDLLKRMEFHGTQKKIKDCFTYNYDIK